MPGSAPHSDIRVSSSDDGIVTEIAHEGTPRRRALTWHAVEGWAKGRPEDGLPAGLWLLLRVRPYREWLPLDAPGAEGLVAELRRRGVSELADAETVWMRSEAHALEDVRRELELRFPPAERKVAWRLLEAEPAAQSAAVRGAVVRLSEGRLENLRELIVHARHDWRDVLLWDRIEETRRR